MKKLTSILLIAGAMAVSAFAQTNTTTTSTNSTPGIWETIASSGLLNATNYAVEPYATYAPSAPKKVGGGLFIAYNVNDYVGVGLGMDYLGQFTLLSAGCQLKYAIHPFSSAPNFAIIPFALASVGQGVNGSGNTGILTTDAGAYVQFGHFLGGTFNTGAAYGKWMNAGAYSGTRYHIFAGWSKGF